MNYSKGISWFDDCRIPFMDGGENTKRKVSGHQKVYGSGEEIYYNLNLNNQQDRNKGRFPANLLVSDDMLNDGSVGGIHKNYIHSGGSIEQKIYGGGKGIPLKANRNIVSDKGTNSRYYDIDAWFDNLLENYIY